MKKKMKQTICSVCVIVGPWSISVSIFSECGSEVKYMIRIATSMNSEPNSV